MSRSQHEGPQGLGGMSSSTPTVAELYPHWGDFDSLFFVASGYHYEEDGVTCEGAAALSRLYSAAPDLLAALERLRAVIVAEALTGLDAKTEMSKALTGAGRAIAKAKGEA